MDIFYLVDTATLAKSRRARRLKPEIEATTSGETVGQRCVWKYAKRFNPASSDHQEWLDSKNELFFVALASTTPVATAFHPVELPSMNGSECSIAHLQHYMTWGFSETLLARLAIAAARKLEDTAEAQLGVALAPWRSWNPLRDTFPPSAPTTPYVGSALLDETARQYTDLGIGSASTSMKKGKFMFGGMFSNLRRTLRENGEREDLKPALRLRTS